MFLRRYLVDFVSTGTNMLINLYKLSEAFVVSVKHISSLLADRNSTNKLANF